MSIRLIAVGKKHEDWIVAGIQRYQKRLKKPFDVEWLLIPYSSRQGNDARTEESRHILDRLKDAEFVILLDERGTLYSSPEFARRLVSSLQQSRPVTVIIGGAYGVDESLHTRADMVWSLSPLVFPHQLVRLIMVEQLYRAQEIIAGKPYHHE